MFWQKSFPFYHQPDARDCGPTCLKMIAEYYGKFYSLDYLRELSFFHKAGVSLLGISKAAEKLGFKTIGGRFTLDKLAGKIILPCIVFWDQSHFVILYKVRKNYKGSFTLFIADPGKGMLTYSDEEFCEHWISTSTNGSEKGIGLMLEPTVAFFEFKEDQRPESGDRVRFLSKYFLRYKRFFGQLIIGLLVGSFLQLIFPFLTQAIVDTGIENQDIGFIWLILIGQMMLLLGRSAIDFIRRRILLHISTRIIISLISDFFIKLMKLPMSFFDSKLIGDLLQRIEDHNRIERFLTAHTLNMIFSLFNFVVFGCVLFVYNLKIFLIFLAGSAVYGIWILFFLKRRRILDYKYFEQQAINRSKVYQLINGMQEIKLQGSEQRKRWEWEDTQADLFDVNMQILSLQQTQEAGSVIINEVKNILITVLAATAVIHGELTLGMMLSVQYIIGQLNSPIEQMMTFIYQWQDVNISLERMSEIHGKRDEEDDDLKIMTLPEASKRTISLRNIVFQYEGPLSKKVLNDVSIDIPEGKVTAIVGASGSGKTTLLKLLLGYYSPVEGEIKIGERALKELNLTWWRSKCGAVMQDGFIFSESIAWNIASSDDEIDINKLQYAARAANIEDFITHLPLSYNTVVGQEGQGVSQGQRQRLLIARAIYKNPPFLFFDEATNALDANNEKVIVENLSSFFHGKTVIIVAHRLSTVKDADQIIVLDNGEVVEQGNHTRLTQMKGAYYKLVKNQLELGT